MSKPVQLSELDIIDIYNLVNTQIENDKILHKTYGSVQNNILINFINTNIGKNIQIKSKINTNIKPTITDEQAFKTVLSIIEDVARK
jgi:hypothetical protein